MKLIIHTLRLSFKLTSNKAAHFYTFKLACLHSSAYSVVGIKRGKKLHNNSSIKFDKISKHIQNLVIRSLCVINICVSGNIRSVLSSFIFKEK